MHFPIVISIHCIVTCMKFGGEEFYYISQTQTKCFIHFMGIVETRRTWTYWMKGENREEKLPATKKCFELNWKQAKQRGWKNQYFLVVVLMVMTHPTHRPVGVFSRSLDPFQTLRLAREVPLVLGKLITYSHFLTWVDIIDKDHETNFSLLIITSACKATKKQIFLELKCLKMLQLTLFHVVIGSCHAAIYKMFMVGKSD